MKFYRLLGKVKAMTFDLDDTLYDNQPIIHKSTLEFHEALQNYHPVLRNFTMDDYKVFHDELLVLDPHIYHDVSEWRYRTVKSVLMSIGLSIDKVVDGTQKIMDVFYKCRSEIEISEETHHVLNYLKKQVPLVIITNGNADAEKLGINQYFQFALRAGPHGRAKPWNDMYNLASTNLGIAREHILHVGDDLTTDVIGSLNSGMQSCWINIRKSNLMQAVDARLIPHMEISQLYSLTSLV